MPRVTVYVNPTPEFPYKISRRLEILAVPKKSINAEEGMPAFTSRGVRKSALEGEATDRIKELGKPYLRKLLLQIKSYKKFFPKERMRHLDRLMQQTNATCYSKLANCVMDLKNEDAKESKKKKGWNEMDWKKHMEYIEQIADPKRQFQLPPIDRGQQKKLDDLMPRIRDHLSYLPEFKMYRRLSQESNYRDPSKVEPNALKYVITDRMKKLATPKVIPTED